MGSQVASLDSNVSHPLSHHVYVYGLNNPVSNTDPSGRCVREYVEIGGVRYSVPGEPAVQSVRLVVASTGLMEDSISGMFFRGLDSLVHGPLISFLELTDGIVFATPLQVSGWVSPSRG